MVTLSFHLEVMVAGRFRPHYSQGCGHDGQA